MRYSLKTTRTIAITGVAMGMLATLAFSQATTIEGFDGGSDGGFTGNAFFEATGGNPDGNAHHLVTAFFLSLRTGGIAEPVNPNFLGDYSSFDQVTFGFDVKVDQLTNFFGGPIAREIGIALVDRDIQGPSGPSGIFYTLAALSSAGQPDWTNLSVTIDDPTSATLPPGWVGFGDEDPNTFEPILPPGATFATVLAGVDEFRISGAIPGFFFNNANFDVRIDNVSVEVTDPPECFLVIGEGPGADTFNPGLHSWETNVSGIEDSYVVLMDDIPSFVIPSFENVRRRFSAGTLGQGTLGGLQVDETQGEVMDWIADGTFAVQIVMWNPEVFPGQPEQFSAGLIVTIAPDGEVASRPYGDSIGMQVWHETDVNANGDAVIRFPFSIDGL